MNYFNIVPLLDLEWVYVTVCVCVPVEKGKQQLKSYFKNQNKLGTVCVAPLLYLSERINSIFLLWKLILMFSHSPDFFFCIICIPKYLIQVDFAWLGHSEINRMTTQFSFLKPWKVALRLNNSEFLFINDTQCPCFSPYCKRIDQFLH